MKNILMTNNMLPYIIKLNIKKPREFFMYKLLNELHNHC